MTRIIILALLAESSWETLKMTWQKDKYVTVDRVGALTVGVLIAFTSSFDILQMLDITSRIPYLGEILSGILISRGANFMHDFIKSLSNLSQNTKSGV